MALSESSATRRDDTSGKSIKTFVDSDGDHIQAIAVVDDSGDQAGISGNAIHVQGTELTAIQAAVEIIDNFISGSRGLVTEDNSASILSELQSLLTELQAKADLSETQPVEEQETPPTDASKNNPSLAFTWSSGELQAIQATIGGTAYQRTLTWSSGELQSMTAWAEV